MTTNTMRSADNAAETQQARVDLAAIFRMSARLQMHEGVCNHFTVMLPGRRFLINPKGVHFERITASGLLMIDEHGKISELKLLQGLGPAIDDEVIQTVNQWVYTPAMKDGVPVPSVQELHFHYERRG